MNSSHVALDCAKPPYVLLELDSMENTLSPIRNTSRIKYTCFDVSRRFVVFGSTSGGVYIFLKESLQYLKTITNKDGPVSQVSLAPDDSIIAFSTSRGHVLVFDHHADKENAQPQRLQFTYDHKGALVTCLHWSNTTARLYAADDAGKVSLINVSHSRTRSLFQVPSAILMKVDSKVVQLDFSKDNLLVSSLSRSYVYNTNTEQWTQIGKKLRDGDFGACLYPGPRYQDACTVFATRPGSRLWESDLRGNVLSTHQFKQALSIPPAKVISFQSDFELVANQSNAAIQSSPEAGSTGFSKLLALWPTSESLPFLLSWNLKGVYILNPKKVEVLLRTDIPNVKSTKCFKNEIYLHHGWDQFSRFTLLPLDRALLRLFQANLNVQCARLMLENAQFLAAFDPPKHPHLLTPAIVEDLGYRLNETGHGHLADLLVPFRNILDNQSSNKGRTAKEALSRKSPRRARSALAQVEPVSRSRRASPQSSRCRSASPMLRQRHSSGSPISNHSSDSTLGGGLMPISVNTSQEELGQSNNSINSIGNVY